MSYRTYRAGTGEGLCRALASAAPTTEEVKDLDHSDLRRSGRVAGGVIGRPPAREVLAALLSADLLALIDEHVREVAAEAAREELSPADAAAPVAHARRGRRGVRLHL